MESRKVEPNSLNLSEENGVSDALREAVEEEMKFLEKKEIKLVRMRSNDEGDVFQITIHAGDEMYRMSEVAPGHVSRTIFRNPEKDGAVPYQKDEKEEEEETEEAQDSEEGEKSEHEEEAEAKQDEEGNDENEDKADEKAEGGDTENDEGDGNEEK